MLVVIGFSFLLCFIGMCKFRSILKQYCQNEYFDNVDDFKMNSNCVFGSNTKQLKTLQINIRGMNDISKFDNLLEFMDNLQSDIHILVISETFIRGHNILSYSITNYTSIFSCRDNRSGGGLALYIRNDIEFCTLNIDNGLYPFQFIQIKLSSFVGTAVCAFYRPPGTDMNCFLSCLDSLLSVSCNYDNILLGDLNIPVNKTDDYVTEYSNLLMSFGLITTNTNITRSASDNILDHAVSSFLNIKKVYNATIYSNISDHNFLYTNFCYESKYVKKTLWKKVVNFDKVNNEFNVFLLSTSFNVHDVNNTFHLIVNKYNELINKYTKITNVEVKLKNTLCPWITYDIWQVIREKNKVLKKFKRNPCNASFKAELERLSKLLKSMKYFGKKHYFNKIFVDLNQRNLWNNINSFFKKNHKSVQLDSIVFNGRPLNDADDIVKHFNEYFVKIGILICESINSDRDIHKFGTVHWNSDSMYFSTVSPVEVYNIIQSLKDCKGGGPDFINNSVVKSRAEFFSKLLSDIFNECLVTGIYPNCLKVAKVIPVFKGGDSLSIDNYRPISTLSVFDKIFEKLIFSRLVNFLDSNNFFYSHQYGFRKGAGTEFALAEISNMIFSAFDNKKYVGSLFLDLQKAFDCIDHELLLSKLFCYGIRGVPYNLLRSYLSNRKQYVMINGIKSDTLDVRCGVPQGSVLGPLLFLVFINDISYLPLIGQIRIFADDTALFYETLDPNGILNDMNHDLKILFEYFKSNLISLNISKTKYMIFHSPHKSMVMLPQLRMDNIIIERVNSFKYLGVTLDVHMTWGEHINVISNKIAPLVGLLRKLSYFVPRKGLLMFYFAFIHSRISYGILAFGTATATRLKKLQVMQNKSLKSVYKLPFLYPTKELYCSVNNLVLPINVLHKFKLSLYMYKTLNISSVLSNIKFDGIHHIYGTRNCKRICYPHIKTEFGRKSITFLGPCIYNEIPDNLKQSESFVKFKSVVKKFFHSNMELYF